MKFMILSLLMAAQVHASCGNKDTNFCNVKLNYKKNGKVDVYDGDTFYVNIDRVHPIFGKRLGIRVKGVNTPELRAKSLYEKEMAQRAKSFTVSALEGAKRIDLSECVRGKYFRIVCQVTYDGKNLSEGLLASGLAIKYEL